MTLPAEKHRLVISYIAAQLIYTNTQRPGVVQFMETTEYLNRLTVNGSVVINVCHHKTVTARGPAKIVVTDPLIITLLDEYYNEIRKKLRGQNACLEKRFFLLSNGNEFSKVYQCMKQVATLFHFDLPSPTLNRKMLISDAVESLPSENVKKIQKYMSHSESTSEKYYQFPSTSEAIQTHLQIQKVANKRCFTKQQDKVILKEWPLAIDQTPTTRICELIATKHNIQKSNQQIQDRWKTLKRKLNS